MLIELGNHAAHEGVDDAPKVTTIHIPEADETGLGGYTHKIKGIDVATFKNHRAEALDFNNGITQLPDHEILLAVANVWPTQSRKRPKWVNVIADPLTPKGVDKDVQAFLNEFYGCDTEKPGNFEDIYWTKFGPPGQGGPVVPDMKALLTNAGRVMANVNDGGGQTGLIGAGTAATATTLTTASTLVTNAWANYRVYCYSTTSNNIVWGNVISNTNAAGASVLTVDRWYNAATPGGAAGTTPTTPWAFILADGGAVAAWFMGLTTTNITPAAADTTLSGEYTTASGGFIRKICPYAQTSGVASRSITLTPVFTGNGSDTYPSTFYAMGAHISMVTSMASAMKYETSLNASATVAATGDQVTVTETVTGS